MSVLRLWLAVGVLTSCPVRPSLVEMLVEEPIHRVHQDSQPGIQTIRIFVDNDGGRGSSSVLPLSIESAGYTQNDQRYDTPSKRQVKPAAKTQARTTSKPSSLETTQKLEASSRPNPLVRNETNGNREPKPNVKLEPLPNQFGIGSTLVLTVGQPAYVDQNQPQKAARPLRYDSEREEPTHLQSTNINQKPLQEEREELYARPHKSDPPQNYEVYDSPGNTQHHTDNGRRQPPTEPTHDSGYGGFPSSFQLSSTLSRPLQNDGHLGFPPSPCPGIFRYEGREPQGDSWQGEIYLNTDEVLVGIWINITLDRPARLLSNYLGEVVTSDNQIFSILSKKRLSPGAAETVSFLVRFDPSRPVPLVQFINLNGRRICPVRPQSLQFMPTTRPTASPVYEYPGDLLTKPTSRPYEQQASRRPPYDPPQKPADSYEQQYPPSTARPVRQPERRPEPTESYEAAVSTRPRPRPSAIERPDPNPTNYEESQANNNRLPTYRPPQSVASTTIATYDNIPCGKPSVQPRPLVTHGHTTARGQWPWHAAIYKNVGIDLSYICGGSLISNRHVVTAAHCVTKTYDVKPVDANVLVVYLGKYHLRLWSEGGVQNKQVSEVKVHPSYNSSDFRADLAVLVLSSPVEFTDYIRPVCLWDRRKTDISQVESREGTVIGWGFDEESRLTEELMQAKMPVIKHDVCLWSYPEFFPQFTSNYTYCAGFRNGTSVCNGDSGGGMVFPMRAKGEEGDRWFLRGLVSISVTEKERKVCDTKHYVVFTDLAKFLDWLDKFL